MRPCRHPDMRKRKSQTRYYFSSYQELIRIFKGRMNLYTNKLLSKFLINCIVICRYLASHINSKKTFKSKPMPRYYEFYNTFQIHNIIPQQAENLYGYLCLVKIFFNNKQLLKLLTMRLKLAF